MKGFVFIAEPLNIVQSKTLYEGFYFSKPNALQIERIEKIINNYTIDYDHKGTNIYTKKIQSVNDSEFNYIDLPISEYKYGIINHENERMLGLLYEGLCLCESHLSVIIHFGSSSHSQPRRQIEFYSPLSNFNERNKLGVINIDNYFYNDFNIKLNNYHNYLKNETYAQFPFTLRSIQAFYSIQEINRKSPFLIVSYFAILEYILISHKVNDSIKDPLSKKISIINSLVLNPVDFNNYILTVSPSNLIDVIKEIYQYRNDIGHGNELNYNLPLKILTNNQNKIVPFLHAVVKMVINFSIIEPVKLNEIRENKP